jgi:hypothetical protein
VTVSDDDDDDREGVDPEGPDPSDMDFSDEPDLAVCPNCRRMISEEAERCQHCGEYITPGETPMPKWVWISIAIVILLLAALLLRH